jgi:anti-anti-sigma factor
MGDLEDGGTRASVGNSVDESGAPVITISGEIDMSNVSTVEAEIDAVTTTSPARLVLDLSALAFIDSSGIALLLRAAAKVGSLEIRSPSAIVQRVLQATGLSDVFRVQP